MDIASALLTKKAALIGGGTAATTTAVVVPVVVTQSQKEKKSPAPSKTEQISNGVDSGGGSGHSDNDTTSDLTDENGLKENPLTQLSLNLDQTDTSLFDSFNKPGDCVKKSFYKVEEKSSKSGHEAGLFHKPSALTGGETTKFGPAKLTNTNTEPNVVDFDYGCFMFNKYVDQENTDYRFEVVLKKNKHGWIWMSGRKNNEVYFREAIVHEPSGSNKWEGYAAVDGKYEDTNKTVIPKFEDPIFEDLEKWKAQDCNNGESCSVKESIGGVFIKGGETDNKFLPSTEADWIDSVLSFGETKTYSSKDSGNKRASFFGGGGWYNHNNVQETVINFEKGAILDSIKGNWKDLIKYCKDDSKTSEKAYAALCPAPQS